MIRTNADRPLGTKNTLAALIFALVPLLFIIAGGVSVAEHSTGEGSDASAGDHEVSERPAWVESLTFHGPGIALVAPRPLVVSFLLTEEKAGEVTGSVAPGKMRLGEIVPMQSIKVTALEPDMQVVERWEFLLVSLPLILQEGMLESMQIRQVLFVGSISKGGQDVFWHVHDDAILIATQVDGNHSVPDVVSLNFLRHALAIAIEANPECLDVIAFSRLNPVGFEYAAPKKLEELAENLAHTKEPEEGSGAPGPADADAQNPDEERRGFLSRDYFLTDSARHSMASDFTALTINALVEYTPQDLSRRLQQSPVLKTKIQLAADALDCLGAPDFAAALRQRLEHPADDQHEAVG